MERRFVGNIPSISVQEQEQLKQKHVLVVGCGGIGGYVMEYLARAGVGKLTVIDHDSFDETNLNRQLYATTASLGKSKVTEAKERAMQINPQIEVEFWMSKLRKSTVGTALCGKDLVIDALDSVEDRLMLEAACAENGIYLIHGAVAGWNLQVMTVSPGSQSLKQFYTHNQAARTRSVLSFVPAACASIQAAEALKFLCGKTPSLKDRMLLFNLKEMKSVIVNPDDHVFAERQIEVAISKYQEKDTYSILESTTIRQILEALELEGENLFVMRNGQYVMPEEFDRAILEEGDFLEIRKSAAFGG